MSAGWSRRGSPSSRTGSTPRRTTPRSRSHARRSESLRTPIWRLYVGRLDPQKGLPDLLDAAEQVIDRHPGWHLVLAGDGPDRDWLLGQLSGRSALGDRVRWLGTRDDVPGLLRSADVLVLASLWEGMPNAVLEAMATRRPVVGTAVEGTEDLIVPGQTGWLVPPRDPEALAQALDDAARDPERCKRYGEAARLRVEHEFSIDVTVAAYEHLWGGVLGYTGH